MRGRLGLMLGFGAGYEQLRRLYDNITASPTFQDAAGKAKEAAGSGLGQAKGMATEGVSKVSGAVKKDSRSNLSVAPAPAETTVPPPTH